MMRRVSTSVIMVADRQQGVMNTELTSVIIIHVR